MSRYTADRIFLNSNIAPFGEMNTICWVRPDYVLQLVNIPVGVILLSNLTVIIAAVATAYRSATFRWKTINRGNIATVWKVSSRNTTTFVKLTGAARNCVTLSATLGLGFLVGFPILRLVFQDIWSQVGFIPCNVSNFIEPYTFTIVNGLSGMKLDFLLKLEEPCPLYSLTDHKSQVSSFFCVIPFVRTKKRCSSNFFTKLSLQSCSPMLTQMFPYHPVMWTEIKECRKLSPWAMKSWLWAESESQAYVALCDSKRTSSEAIMWRFVHHGSQTLTLPWELESEAYAAWCDSKHQKPAWRIACDDLYSMVVRHWRTRP